MSAPHAHTDAATTDTHQPRGYGFFSRRARYMFAFILGVMLTPLLMTGSILALPGLEFNDRIEGFLDAGHLVLQCVTFLFLPVFFVLFFATSRRPASKEPTPWWSWLFFGILFLVILFFTVYPYLDMPQSPNWAVLGVKLGVGLLGLGGALLLAWRMRLRLTGGMFFSLVFVSGLPFAGVSGGISFLDWTSMGIVLGGTLLGAGVTVLLTRIADGLPGGLFGLPIALLAYPLGSVFVQWGTFNATITDGVVVSALALAAGAVLGLVGSLVSHLIYTRVYHTPNRR